MSDRFARLFQAPDGMALPHFNASFARGAISDEVANQIMTMIKNGFIKAGDKLPTESQMTLALGISRQPLREALKALTLMGILESRQGGRYTVTDLSPLRLVEPFNVMLSGKCYDTTHHYEARNVVDLECVRLCVERASPERRREISRLAAEGTATIGKPLEFRTVDRGFHGAIYAGSGNAFLETVALGLFTIAIDIRRSTASLPGLIALSCEDYIRIADAIADGDGPRAVEAYRGHLLHVRDTTIRILDAATQESVS